jgi:hypothetical protein
MNTSRLNRIIAFSVFAVALVTYIRTLSPTVVFWDVGEFMAAARLLQVPHPPGAPLFLLVARVFSIVPFAQDIAVRMHIISAISSALTVMLLYLISVKLIIGWRGKPETTFDRIVVYGSSVIGALAMMTSPTFWFNAVEAEVYGLDMLIISLIIWLGLRYYEHGHGTRSDVYLLLVAYLAGLSMGVHLLALLALWPVMLLVYFRSFEFDTKNFLSSLFSWRFLAFGAVAIVVFFAIFKGVLTYLPSFLDGEVGGKKIGELKYLPYLLVLGAAYGAYYAHKHKRRILSISLLSFLFVVLGFSTYIMVYMRANADTPMNENNPDTIERLVQYLDRQQYGDYPKLLPRRWNTSDPEIAQRHQNYTSEFDYFWRFQLDQMYLRYFGWNFVGREGDWKDAGVDWTKLYGIPLFLGFFGAYYHWSREKKTALMATVAFIVLGVALVVYFNMQNPQPRERDYFYVGSFFIFALWIGIGISGILDFLREKLAPEGQPVVAGVALLVVAFLAVPANMFRVNFHSADRTGNYLAWDYSYNLLQSCEKDAILFTNGDNDTFPLWYLQDVEGVRRDIRVVNLSLLNTDWYIRQLKDDEPHGAKKVPISLPDNQIAAISPIQYEPRTFLLPVPDSVLQMYQVTDTAITNRKAISFFMPQGAMFGNVKALRVQDLMVLDIVFTSRWARPIYFAMTVSDDGKIGLRDYMRMEGLAFRLVPIRSQNFWESMDVEKVRGQLFTDITEPSLEPHVGFRWRGLQDSTVYYDEDARRLMMNYRQAFLSLGYYYTYKEQRVDKFAEVLDRMEKEIPRNVMPMPAFLKFDIANTYRAAGKPDQAEGVLRELAADLQPVVDRGEKPQLAADNAYLLLFQCYEGLQQYAKANEILDKIKFVYAAEPGVDQFIREQRNRIEAKMAADSLAAMKPAAPAK